ncbi:hypothetical protein H0H93_002099, partial [Arthromyces matolae]
CLNRLEEEMFERSLRAGISGHYQWGLDAGDHQNAWDPYLGLPEEWNHGDRPGDDAELQRGWNYISVKPALSQPIKAVKPRPQPRP